MKRLVVLGAAAALSLAGVAGLVGTTSPVSAAADCTITVHLDVNLNGNAQSQDLCLPEGLGAPALPA